MVYNQRGRYMFIKLTTGDIFIVGNNMLSAFNEDVDLEICRQDHTLETVIPFDRIAYINFSDEKPTISKAYGDVMTYYIH